MNRAEQETRARVFLNRLGRISRRMKLKREQVQALHELATSATAQISDMPRSGVGVGKKNGVIPPCDTIGTDNF